MSAAAARRLIAPAALRELSERSDAAGLARLALHLAAIACGGGLVWLAYPTLWMLPAMAALGLALVSLFAPLHETVHYTAFRSRRLNDAVGWLAGAAIGLNAQVYRDFHLAHHRWCQNPARDPELNPPAPATRAAYLRRLLAWNYWRARGAEAWAIARGDFTGRDWIPQARRVAATRSVQAQLALYAGVALVSFGLQSAAALWFWLVPMLLAQPALRAYLLAEHTLCDDGDDPRSNTRTTLAAWPIRLLMWNMPFHAEHHLYPQIPFHALPRAHALLRPHLAHVAPGYAATHRAIRAQLRRAAP